MSQRTTLAGDPSLLPGTGSGWERLAEDLYRFRDTCYVYLLKDGERGVLIDFGSGEALERAAEVGVTTVSDVLMTHHHRDQGQGLPKALAAGIRVWVPQAEQELFRGVDFHWQARELDNSYNNRQDRFSLLEPVSISGTLDDYAIYQLGKFDVEVLPTPGHTVGSVTLVTTVDDLRVAFSGDLIAGPGKLWSLAATQWSYNGAEGVAATLASTTTLREQNLDLLLPSHGSVMREPNRAMELLEERLWGLLRRRRQNSRLREFQEEPFESITPHLLRNRSSLAYSYVLLSQDGPALFIDFGYDFNVGTAAGSDRASRRPWLYTLPKLKELHGVTSVEVAIPTHYHDDHVAGLNLLRRVEGTEVWASESFADVLTEPWRFDLACLWYDPIDVDRRLPLETTLRWREYELTLHDLPGHTSYAVAISFEVDGKRVLAVGDQFEGGVEARWNYVYNNGFHPGDYLGTARLLERLRPDLLLAGHYLPHAVDEEFIREVSSGASELARIHRDLLPVDEFDFGGGDRAVSLIPYRATVNAESEMELRALVRNPFQRQAIARVELVTPVEWEVRPPVGQLELGPGELGSLAFTVVPRGNAVRRARVAADLTVGGIRLGQQAEALVTVERRTAPAAPPEEERRQ